MASRDPKDYVRNVAFAVGASQAGCVTVIIVIGALFLGIWLDGMLNTKPVLTVGLMILSIPFSLMIMVYIALSAVRRITPPKAESTKPKDEMWSE